MRREKSRLTRRWLAVAILLGACASLGACSDSPQTKVGAPEPERGSVRDIDFDFEDQAAAPGTIVPGVTNNGMAKVVTSISTVGGGRAILTSGVDGGYGLRLPAFGAAEATAAAVVVRSAEARDALSPENESFRFGADFALDRLSSGSGADDGNNLMQRGLTADSQQYKIQVDKGVPSCRVAGTEGSVVVESDVVVTPERWYRVSCLRLPDRLVLTVTPWAQTGWGTERVSTISGKTGNVRFDSHSVPPLAIGAKVDANGDLTESATDQFNGAVDNVYFEVVR